MRESDPSSCLLCLDYGWLVLAGLLHATGCLSITGIDCAKHCCTNDDCKGGKLCQYGECLCPNDLADCGDGVCVSPPCPTCTDMAQNGAETDIDCGGPTCLHCVAGLACSVPNDCQSNDCQNNVCQSANSSCQINGTGYASGALDPANGCESCQPSVSASNWTNLADGTPCGLTQICCAGTCQTGCFIDSTFYGSDAIRTVNNCQSCQPAKTTSEWTNVSNGANCATGIVPHGVCDSGNCHDGCWIGGYVGTGAYNMPNVCQSCQPSKSTSSWQPEIDGKSCGGGLICTGGYCGTSCLIQSTTYNSGQVNPGNPCQSCQPGSDASNWTTSPDGASCGPDKVCHDTGTCDSGCWIESAFKADGARNTSPNLCQVCDPSQSTMAWSTATNGWDCGTGLVCHSNDGSCATGCFIGGQFKNSGDENPSNACRSCQPTTSTSDWSDVANDTSCGTSKTCSSGVCITTAVIVQENVGTDPNAKNLTVILPNATTVGNVLVMVGASRDSPLSSGTGVTGGGVSPSWTFAIRSTTNADIEIWYGVVSSPSKTVTLTAAGAGHIRANVTEWSGLIAALDGKNAGAGTGRSASAGSITTANPKDLIIFGVDDGVPNSFGTPTPGTWTPMMSVTEGDFGCMQFLWRQTVSATATFSPTVTETSGQWDAAIVAFKIQP